MRAELAAAVLGAAATSIFYAAAYPPYRYSAFAWVAMAPFLIVVRRMSLQSALAAAVLFPLFACALTIDWMPRAAATYYGQPFLIGIATFLAIALVMVAPWVVTFTLVYRFIARRPGGVVPLLAAAAWTCAEYTRSHVLTGNPFVLLGYSQAGVASMRQIADITGVYGVSFVLAAANVALAEAWLARGRPERRRGAIAGMLLAATLVGACAAYGDWRLRSPGGAGKPTPVLLVQGNLDLGSQWRDELYGKNLDVYLRLTIEGMQSARPSLVVWPENAMTFFVAREPLYRLAIGRVLAPHAVQLLAGGPHFIEEENRYLNSAFLIAAVGDVVARYDKEKLLPFAEYFPFPQLDVLRRSFGRVREFSPGAGGPPLATSAGAAGILICNEAMFPEIAARRVDAGAELLVNLANDSWINDAQYAELALDMAIFRAVEQRRFLIRSSTSGPSAIIDPEGRVLERTEPGMKAILSGGVERRSATTSYAAVGDLFAAGCGLITLLGLGRAHIAGT